MNALLAQFIPEARELLELAGSGMLRLEKAQSPEALNDVFRAVHTLKGTSGLFDIAPLTHLVHAAEDLLVEVRTGHLALEPAIVDGLLDSLDLVAHWIDVLETREALPADAERVMTGRVAALRHWLAAGEAGAGAGPAAATPAAAPAWVAEFPEAELRAAYRAAAREGRLTAWAYEPDDSCFFRGEDPAHLVREAPGLLAVRVLPRGPLADLDAFDPFACQLRFEALAAAPPAAVAEHLRYVADQAQIAVIAADALVQLTGRADEAEMYGEFAAQATRLLATGAHSGLAGVARAFLGIVAEETRQACALRWLAEIAGGDADEAVLARLVAEIGGPAPETRPADPVPGELGTILAAQGEMLATPGEAGLAEGRLASAATVLRRCLPLLPPETAAPLAAALAQAEENHDPAPLLALLWPVPGGPVPGGPVPGGSAPGPAAPPVAAPAPPAAEAPDAKAPTRMLRVEQGKVDALMNLVAELTVAKNGLAYLAGRVEQVSGSRQLGREIKEQYAVIDRLAQSLQVGVMAIRMMPVSQVFQRFPRLVRDISRKLGKEVELVIQGEDTEADKNVLESLADPLIHMVRNSLDHGIETPAERRAAGKPPEGRLRLSARQENDTVIIEVADDGKGIDPEAVRAKAVRAGLISAEQAAQMSPQEAVELVFAAGFSTREQVSDLSGRGVGMDVVRTAVRKAGGDVQLSSRLGGGTCVTVQLPLTMAVTRIVTIEVCGQQFGVAMDAVAETVKVPRAGLHRIKQRETFVLRDAVIPVLRLADRLGLPPHPGEPPAEEAVMVVRIGRDRIGIVVDGFRERMEVIVRPLDGLLADLTGFSGTALLGDGRVLLVLNLPDLL
ncbi:chemotaxis protein CheA [Methylobacterium sp. ID0610]|uniref:chemotaxis protein CheA n=1 Tax=Methylobacterium carpenticola TaxID=3344827 RepID=UPI0036813394